MILKDIDGRIKTQKNKCKDMISNIHEHDGILHSHISENDAKQDILILTSEFIEGFTQSNDKLAYLKISGFPHEIESTSGGPSLKLINARVETNWQLGTASPSFGSAELTYLPYPRELVTNITNMIFTFVSLHEKRELDLVNWISDKHF